jgi:hypothetical protein
MTLHTLFTRMAALAPNSQLVAELSRTSAALEASHPDSAYGMDMTQCLT